MMYLDSLTHLPRHLAELWSDRNIKMVGAATWNSTTNQVTTQNLRLICTPVNGGQAAVTTIPDGGYGLGGGDTAVWAGLRRTPGTTTLTYGVDLLDNLAAQPYPQESMVQLFYRTAQDEILAFGGTLVGPGPAPTKIGGTSAGIYDFVVGPLVNPITTHQSLQAAIAAAVDGNRILVLEGTYPAPATPSNPGVDPSAAFAWAGMTLTIEGCGYGTIITNPGNLARAFTIKSTDGTANGSQGSGSRLLSLQLQGFNQSVQLDGGIGLGCRECQADLWMTAVAAYTPPTLVGSGTSEQNNLREYLVTTAPGFTTLDTTLDGAYGAFVQRQRHQTLSIENGGSAILAVDGQIGIGTIAPLRTLDCVGTLRVSSGAIYSPGYFAFLTDGNAAQDVKVGSLTISNTYAASAPTYGLYCLGVAALQSNLNVAGTVNVATLAPNQVVITDGGQNLTSLAYDTGASGSSLVQRTSNGYIFANYFNAPADTGTPSGNIGAIAIRNNSDYYLRWASIGTVLGSLGLGSAAYLNADQGASGGTVVQRTGGGYVNATYFNASANDIGGGVTRVAAQQGDNYYRWATAGAIQGFLGLGSAAYYTASNTYNAGNTVAIRDANGWINAAAFNGGDANIFILGISGEIVMNDHYIYLRAGSDGNHVIHYNGAGLVNGPEIAGYTSVGFRSNDPGSLGFAFIKGGIFQSYSSYRCSVSGNNEGLIGGHGGNAHSFSWKSGSGGASSNGPAGNGQYQFDLWVDSTRVLSWVMNANQVGTYFHW